MFRDKKRFGQDPTRVVGSSDATFQAPRRWKESRRIFTCSWSDFFIADADPYQKHFNRRWEIAAALPAAVRGVSIEPLLAPIDLSDALQSERLSWVIVGGESGPGARMMNPEWVRFLRDQCLEAGVPFFFKQWGGVFKNRNGRTIDGRTWDQLP